MFEKACPSLPVRSLDVTEAFYSRLGFTTTDRFEEEGYLIMMRDAAELHFFRSPAHVPEQSEHGAYIFLTDAAGWSAELAGLGLPSTGIPRFEPAESKPWGMDELAIGDPDGNLLRCGTISRGAGG